MKLRLTLLILLVAVSLQGCYWYETLTLRINLDSKTGVVEMGNVSSVPDNKQKHWSKKNIQADWEGFLKDYTEGALVNNKQVSITDKQLNDNNDALNAVIKFSYSDLSQIDIKKSADNSMYLMKKGPNDKVIETNGKTVTIDSVEYISWSVNEKELFIKYRMLEEKDKHYALVKQYRKWKQQQGK